MRAHSLNFLYPISSTSKNMLLVTSVTIYLFYNKNCVTSVDLKEDTFFDDEFLCHPCAQCFAVMCDVGSHKSFTN